MFFINYPCVVYKLSYVRLPNNVRLFGVPKKC